MTPPPDVFELRVAVVTDDIDQLGHVNNLVYLRWVQDVAIAHWTAAAEPAHQAALYWVIARHEIDYKQPALRGDEVLLQTWVGTATRIRFDRHTEIRRAADRTLLARARTVWVPMSRATHRPVEVPGEVRRRFSIPAAPP